MTNVSMALSEFPKFLSETLKINLLCKKKVSVQRYPWPFWWPHTEFPKFLSETFKNKSIMQKNKYRYKGIHDPFDDDDDDDDDDDAY